jgi:hypothetical protein
LEEQSTKQEREEEGAAPLQEEAAPTVPSVWSRQSTGRVSAPDSQVTLQLPHAPLSQAKQCGIAQEREEEGAGVGQLEAGTTLPAVSSMHSFTLLSVPAAPQEGPQPPQAVECQL